MQGSICNFPCFADVDVLSAAESQFKPPAAV
jgi:hypothetical protein